MVLLLVPPAWGQDAEPNLADYRVYTQHPRLWLDGGRLDRLRREVERSTDRWRQLQILDQNGATFPEEPLWLALQFQAAESEEAGRKAIEWALGRAGSPEGFQNPDDLRLGAVIYDWCYGLLSEDERNRLAPALGAAAKAIAGQSGLEAGPIRSAVLAAIAVADDWEESEQTLLELIHHRWRGQVQPALEQGKTPDRSAELMATLELFHAVRYNLEQDLWRESETVFRPLPRVRMLRYYPQPMETETGYARALAEPSSSKLDPRDEGPPARIAEMMLVAYENTLEEYQFLQGWIRHDAYVLHDPYGAVYEFMWVNPYLPGLSFSNSPPVAHDEVRGRVFARKGWDEGDVWTGYIGGELQIEADGQRMIIEAEDEQAPLTFPGAAVVLAHVPMRFDVEVPPAVSVREQRQIFVVGLREGETYKVKVNGAKERTYTAGRGGIVVIRNALSKGASKIDFDKKIRVRVRPGKN